VGCESHLTIILRQGEYGIMNEDILIHDSDNWTVYLDKEGNTVVAYFLEGHYCGEIVLGIDEIKNKIKVVRHYEYD
jgi:hypothetical protein